MTWYIDYFDDFFTTFVYLVSSKSCNLTISIDVKMQFWKNWLECLWIVCFDDFSIKLVFVTDCKEAKSSNVYGLRRCSTIVPRTRKKHSGFGPKFILTTFHKSAKFRWCKCCCKFTNSEWNSSSWKRWRYVQVRFLFFPKIL